MNDQDLERTIQAMRTLSEDLASSPEKALAFLVKCGILTPEGELTEPYRSEEIAPQRYLGA